MHASNRGWAAAAAHLLFAAVVAAILSVFSGSGTRGQTFEPRQEEPEEFPDFPGREDTFYFCSACHNFQLVARQGMSRQRWDGVLDLMTERHGMPDVSGKEREALLDYLEKAFPESAARGGWQNPFLKR